MADLGEVARGRNGAPSPHVGGALPDRHRGSNGASRSLVDGTLPELPPGQELVGVVCGDSSAAIAISQRRGCGKLRHIRVGELWIQEKILEKELEVKKVPDFVLEVGREIDFLTCFD